MDIDVARRVYRNVDRLVCNDVLRDDGTGNGGHSEDVDTRGTGRSGVITVRMIARYVVSYDHVVIEVLAGGVTVEGNTRQAIVRQLVCNHNIAMIFGSGY